MQPPADSAFCNLCGVALGHEYHLFTQSQGERRLVACHGCYARAERCTVCGAPVAATPPRLSDGRPICAVCRETAVDDPVMGRAIYEEVRRMAATRLGLTVHLYQGFALYSRNDMERLRSLVTDDIHGRQTKGHLLGAFLKLSPRYEIVVETGLPRLLFCKVVAHEYGHAWQAENASFQRDALLVEGFCEWVAYHILGALNAAAVQECQRAAGGLNGDGLRLLLAIEADGGIPAVLAAVRAISPAARSDLNTRVRERALAHQ